VRPDPSGPAQRRKFPASIETRGLQLSFGDGGGGDITFNLEFRPPRSFTCSVLHYPELIEFHAMPGEFGNLLAWNGRYFRATATTNEDSGSASSNSWNKPFPPVKDRELHQLPHEHWTPKRLFECLASNYGTQCAIAMKDNIPASSPLQLRECSMALHSRAEASFRKQSFLRIELSADCSTDWYFVRR
jgi:hypothetical protein